MQWSELVDRYMAHTVHIMCDQRPLACCVVDGNFLVGLASWLGCYNQWVSYIASRF
jgi:hypothetical protein